ncbi:pentatricopeptide repeat-containing protein At5g14080-like [Syzygium oleosum]|uniref:pentatricopeptide repeat-containing protein At5g14080-like n=1 Tax=Syzygium oleosum TaxID=219896 RepID=UPI0024BA01BB|nr:pentatricopeptide repeat-containing protein At5g14080-like [Syzygium oleosum]
MTTGTTTPPRKGRRARRIRKEGAPWRNRACPRGGGNRARRRISRALISASSRTVSARTWTASLEQALHRLGCRDLLTPQLVARVIDPFLIPHPSLALGFFDWASQQPGFAHDPLTYRSVLKSLSASRQSNAVEALLKRVRARGISLDASAYGHVIACFVRNKRTHDGFLVFSEIGSLVGDVGPDVCNLLLAALASDGYIDNARKVFDEMMQWGVRLSTLGLGVFLWKFCGNGEISEVLSALDEVRRRNAGINGSVIAVLVVHGLCQASRVSEALWVLDELRSRSCKPDFMAYRIVAEAFREMGDVVQKERVLKLKRKLGVAPRANDYKEFLFTLISERLMKEASELGEVIVSGDFPLEDDILNALIGTISADDPQSAIAFFRFMIKKGKFPTLLTLSNLCRNLCKHNQTDVLMQVYQVLDSGGYFADAESYTVMVSFLCRAGKVREAYGILQVMKKKGLGPDVVGYNSVLEACCREDLIRPAKRLWDEMFSSGYSGDFRTYTILIKKFSEIGQVEEARRLFYHMLEKGLEPDSSIYKSLIEGLCQEANFEVAFNIFDKCIEQDATLASSVLSAFILCLCRKGDFVTASKLLQRFNCDLGNLDSHVTFLKYLNDADEARLALEHMKWIRENSSLMMNRISSELVFLVSSASKSEPILNWLDRMQAKELPAGQ